MRKKSTSGTSESQKSGRQFAYQRGSQRDGSPHYVFLYSEDDQSEDEEQRFPMKINKSSGNIPRKVEVIHVQIQSDDTLQALALRYQCTISELKRINNIHKDNEIHAHHTIKVPIQPFSLLTESLDQSNKVDEKNEANTDEQVKDRKIPSEEDEIINVLSIPTTSSAVEINDIILKSTVEPSVQFKNDSCEFVQDTETNPLILSSRRNSTAANDHIVNSFKCSGADWGLSWFQLLCFSLLLGFAGPIIYVLYIAESPKHHSSNRTLGS